MELRDYLKIIAKRIWLLLGVIVLVMLGVYFYSASQTISYSGSARLYVSVQKNASENPPYYQYDNYYAQQSSLLFADTVVAWLQDTSNITEIYKAAGVDLSNVNLADTSKLVQAKKNQGGAVDITYNSRDRNIVENVLIKSEEFAKNKVKNWAGNVQTENINIESSDPVVFEKRPELTLNMLIGLAAGIFLGLVLVFFVEYVSEKK